eukprot:3663670-Rhodomonas_salina.1
MSGTERAYGARAPYITCWRARLSPGSVQPACAGVLYCHSVQCSELTSCMLFTQGEPAARRSPPGQFRPSLRNSRPQPRVSGTKCPRKRGISSILLHPPAVCSYECHSTDARVRMPTGVALRPRFSHPPDHTWAMRSRPVLGHTVP